MLELRAAISDRAHVEILLAQIYNRHAYREERRAALVRWANYVFRSLVGTEANVMPSAAPSIEQAGGSEEQFRLLGPRIDDIASCITY
jgi:hypothetical protein